MGTGFAREYQRGLELKVKLGEIREERKRAKELMGIEKENLELRQQMGAFTRKMGTEQLGLAKAAGMREQAESVRAGKRAGREEEDWKASFHIFGDPAKLKGLDPDRYSFIDPKTGFKKYRVKASSMAAWSGLKTEAIQRAVLDADLSQKRRFNRNIKKTSKALRKVLVAYGVPAPEIDVIIGSHELGSEVPDYVMRSAGVLGASDKQVAMIISKYKADLELMPAMMDTDPADMTPEDRVQFFDDIWQNAVNSVTGIGETNIFDRYKKDPGQKTRTQDVPGAAEYHE